MISYVNELRYASESTMFSNFALLGLATPELVLILLIVLLLFGGKRLPELSRNLSSSIQEHRKGLNEGTSGEKNKNDEEKKSETTNP
jgi:sec-independent protein translocase protein TatA